MRVDISQVALILERKALAIRDRTRDAERQNARDALAIARAQSSGPLSTEQLVLMGHPYARRRPRPPFSAAIINVQTGLFRALWRLQYFRADDRGVRSLIVNDAPYARFLTEWGTRLMIGRPIVRAVAQRLRRVRERRLKDAIRLGLEQ